jgi:hypothetical protein
MDWDEALRGREVGLGLKLCRRESDCAEEGDGTEAPGGLAEAALARTGVRRGDI